MATEPIAHFSNRVAAVSAALSMTGARPAAAEAMARADEKISARMADFDDHYANKASDDKLKAAAAKWVKLNRASFKDLDELILSPTPTENTTVPIYVNDGWGGKWEYHNASTPEARRLATARKHVLNGLIAKYDKPDYSTEALIESCKPDVRAWFDNLATEYTEAVAALDDNARDRARRGNHMTSILELIDLATTPEATITAYRRAVRAWKMIDNKEAHESLARAMAFHDVSDTPDPERDVFRRLEEMTSNRARYRALMFDAQTCALSALGMGDIEAVCKGLGHIAPLADPLGDDLPELEHRIDAIRAVDAWLDYRERTVGDPYRGKGWHEPYERFGMATPEQSLAALKEYNPTVFEYKTDNADDYDLDAVDDPYEN
ncbi:hypothetical protein QP958_06700 [Corynebacterium marquesiae]|uniref:hypothetical protein n=1 Tax=Corynebacterium marquesiae TaxID=2913503 RepID=UPI00254B733B|nr:hypothetical protein [Corynebacterium marquesiae]MDK8455087.1 hypothetical protein [Corynebacterium marquesiae]MDK8725204.1 hypothetical protein [Corynebacterium marquesiae]MDK8770524.1 hypothetical protein [Corynebacterium marquesiae]